MTNFAFAASCMAPPPGLWESTTPNRPDEVAQTAVSTTDSDVHSSGSWEDDSCIAPPPGLFLEGISEASTATRSDDEAEHTASPSVATSDSDSCSWEAHVKGKCKPCAYFWAQEDGCRRGDDCDFCHEYHAQVKKKPTKWDNLKKLKRERAKKNRAKAAAEEEAKVSALKAGAAEYYSGHAAAPRGDEDNLNGGFQDSLPARVMAEATEYLSGQTVRAFSSDKNHVGTDFKKGVPARIEIRMPARVQIQMTTETTPTLTMGPSPTAMPPMLPFPPNTKNLVTTAVPGIAPDPMVFVQRTALSAHSRPYVPADALNLFDKHGKSLTNTFPW